MGRALRIAIQDCVNWCAKVVDMGGPPHTHTHTNSQQHHSLGWASELDGWRKQGPCLGPSGPTQKCESVEQMQL